MLHFNTQFNFFLTLTFKRTSETPDKTAGILTFLSDGLS